LHGDDNTGQGSKIDPATVSDGLFLEDKSEQIFNVCLGNSALGIGIQFKIVLIIVIEKFRKDIGKMFDGKGIHHKVEIDVCMGEYLFSFEKFVCKNMIHGFIQEFLGSGRYHGVTNGIFKWLYHGRIVYK
jgi:hypothetical protein